ncbi:hypothetical protein ACGFNF_20740 [Micromonospora sp. NPDC048868]|uniref:hypothetical protein n=1 Tax=Micromonospora sp. NPDC048868 TaxID=3364258 RepID=UPI00371260AB
MLMSDDDGQEKDMAPEPPIPEADKDGEKTTAAPPPAAAEPEPPATEPAPPKGRSLLTHAGEQIAPGMKDLPPPEKPKFLLIMIAVAIVSLLATLVVTHFFNRETADSRVGTDLDAGQRHDQAKTPFVASVKYDRTIPEFWRIVLDRPLTQPEQVKLESLGSDVEIWRFLRSLGGRLLPFPSMIGGLPGGFTDPSTSDAAVFTMNIISDRTTQLSIIDMHAVNVSCQPSTAKAVIDVAPEGGAAYEGMLFDLTEEDPIPYIADDVEEQGRPYFSRRKIDLGGGMSPGGLRVEAVTGEKSCSWEIEATYHDSTPQGGGKLILRDGEKPFVVEARPRHPEQYWIRSSATFPVLNPPNLVPCHRMPTAAACQGRFDPP